MAFSYIKELFIMGLTWVGRLLGLIDDPGPIPPTPSPTPWPSTEPTLKPSSEPSFRPSFRPSSGPTQNPITPPDPLCMGVSSNLTGGESLYSYQDPRWICSPSGVYRMGLTEMGDLVILENGELSWSAFSFHPEPVFLRMQGDGNLVIRQDSDLSVVWTSSTFGNTGLSATLHLTDFGLAQITPASDETTVLWQSFGCGQWPARDGQLAGVKTADNINATSLFGKVVTAYMGWHNNYCTGQWRAWSNQNPPGPQTYEFEMWPEMDEYDGDGLCETDFLYDDGSVASLYSSYDWKTVDTHVKWLSDYGIDGLIMQQFLGTSLCFRTTVLRNVIVAAEKYGRVFAVNLDVSGTTEEDVYDRIIETWKFLVDHEEITESDLYLHHNGRPLLGLWGFGFLNRPGEPDKVMEVIDWFQNTAEAKYQVTLMGGVPEGWQTLERQSKTNEAWSEVYRSFDVISPWTVGRYRNTQEADDFRTDYTEPNLQELNSLGKDYLPVVFPGFSWSYRNIKEDTDVYMFNEIPRAGGDFLWRQMYNAIDAFRTQNASFAAALYVATLDEVDEGTAIYKLSTNEESVPNGASFVTLDVDGVDLPSDWYLQLVGSAAASLRNNEALPVDRPDN